MTRTEFNKEIGRLRGTTASGALWIKDPDTGNWHFSREVPTDGRTWISDDIHAELRKEWIDRGKPQVQFFNWFIQKWEDVIGEPSWGFNAKYRIKPQV